MDNEKIYDYEKEVLRKRNLELNTMISELEDKNTQLLLEDQKYIKLTNQVLNNVHLKYFWRAVKQVLRDTNVDDFKDNDYKKLMERACRILTEDKRGNLKQAWNNFLLFFNENNEIGAEIKNINCVLENTRVVMDNDVYKELYRYFTAKKVHNGSLNLLDNEKNFLKSYPSEKKRKSISNEIRNMRNKTRNFLKNKRNETSNFLKKKRNQTRNFFKNKRQNITQKVGNLRKRLFGKKNNRETIKNKTLSNKQINNWRKMYNRKTLNNKTLSKIKNNNFMGYNEMVHPFLRQQEEPTEARNMAMNSKKNNPYEYMYRPYGYMHRVNGPTSKHPPPPPPRSGRFPVTQLIVPDSEIKLNNYVNSSNNNEYGNSSNNNNKNNTTLTV